MSKKSEITVAERQILDFIKFRSNSKHRFFGSNEYLGDSIGVQTTSAKNMVNRLVRLGYLTRTMEGQKRYLQYTGKKYLSVVGDLRNYDKAYLKKEVAHYKQEFKDAEDTMELMKIEINQLKDKVAKQAHEIMIDNRIISVLKSILEQLGIKDDELQKLSEAVYKEKYGDD
ncbi:MAG: hypothetical protein J6N49_05955 [Alphaproteobacteria bacterium]|nr:hypothetical protein [Alphaproteobacteria bacterium]